VSLVSMISMFQLISWLPVVSPHLSHPPFDDTSIFQIPPRAHQGRKSRCDRLLQRSVVLSPPLLQLLPRLPQLCPTSLSTLVHKPSRLDHFDVPLTQCRRRPWARHCSDHLHARKKKS